MKLTNAQAQALMIGCKQVDADDSTKLKGDVRRRLGINLKRLSENVEAFERALRVIQQELNGLDGRADRAARAKELMEDADELIKAEEEYDLKIIKIDELKLDSNQKIKVDLLARLAPVIEDFETE